MTKILRYLKPYLLLLFILMIFTIGQVMSNLSLPDFMASIVNQGIVGRNQQIIYQKGLMMLLVALGGGLCSVVVGYLASRIGTGVARNIRAALFKKVEGFSLAEFNKFSTASLITRNTNDVQQIQNVLIVILRMALMAPFMGIIAIIKAYHLVPVMTWIMAVAVIALVVVIAVIFSIALPKFALLQKLVDKLNLVTRELLTGIRVIRAFGKERHEEERFAEANNSLTKTGLFVNRLMSLLQPFMMLTMNLTSIAIVWIGARQIESGNLAIGDMLAFMQYAMQALFAFLMISIIFIMVPRASISARRIAEVLSTNSTVEDPIQPKTPAESQGLIEFKNVSFSYAGAEEAIIKDITFSAKPGETTAIVGSTGSGKTTLLNLIPRFYDATTGSITVDGIDVKDMSQEYLRSRIGFVSQKAILFSGTIRDNISYGNPSANKEEIEHAAIIAQASFINDSEAGYEAPVSQGGSNVSGGQRQRLAIARALVRKPEIYLFDDSFSALDFKTDALLREALTEETKDKTVIIVAQRISTIMNAAKILVMDCGKIVAQGNHASLMLESEVYREIAGSQLSETELSTQQNRN